MKILREKIFGAIKRANKAKKKAWEVEAGGKISGWESAPDFRKKQVGRAMRFAGSSGALDINLKDNKNGEDIQNFFRNEKRDVHSRINSKAMWKSLGDERSVRDTARDEIGYGVDYYLSRDSMVDNKLRDKYDALRRGTAKLGKATPEEKERIKAASQTKKDRIAASKASIEKHKEKADKLRNDNKLKVAARDAKRNAKKWIKENPGKSAAIGATVAAAGAGLGYAAYKHHKNKKKEEK